MLITDDLNEHRLCQPSGYRDSYSALRFEALFVNRCDTGAAVRNERKNGTYV